VLVLSRMITRPRVRHFENHIERTMFLKKERKWLRKFMKNGYRKNPRKIYKNSLETS
jgi:predicted RNA-binding protein